MDSRQTAIAIGSVFGGALCVWGAFSQVRDGQTWGLTGGRVMREDCPGYFWFLFLGRMVLGPVAVALGLLALLQR